MAGHCVAGTIVAAQRLLGELTPSPWSVNDTADVTTSHCVCAELMQNNFELDLVPKANAEPTTTSTAAALNINFFMIKSLKHRTILPTFFYGFSAIPFFPASNKKLSSFVICRLT